MLRKLFWKSNVLIDAEDVGGSISRTLRLTEARDGDVLEAGKALLARGGTQMSIAASGGRWRISYGTSESVNRHWPSVDVLFDSVARQIGRQAVGILLTGMGADGAQGLLRMREAGAVTAAQDQRSCVVYGMPKVAADLGAAQHVGPPAEMPGTVLQALLQRTRAHTRQAASAR